MSIKQGLFGESGFELQRGKKTRKRVFLEQMDAVVPWAQLVELIAPHVASGTGPKGGRPAFPVETKLRIYFLQQWFNLGDEAMEESLHDVELFRAFAGLDKVRDRMPDETSFWRFRKQLVNAGLCERILATVNELLISKGLLLKTGSVVDATIISAPSSTKNKAGQRDPQMHQTRKGNQWYFGMKAHIGTDLHSGLVHTVIGTAANVSDISQASDLVRDTDRMGLGDAGFQGIEKRKEVRQKYPQLAWYVALRPGKRRALDKKSKLGALKEMKEKLKSSLRATVEHPFRVIKQQFGYVKVRYKGLRKNTAQLHTLFALSNLWMVRRLLLPNKA